MCYGIQAQGSRFLRKFEVLFYFILLSESYEGIILIKGKIISN